MLSFSQYKNSFIDENKNKNLISILDLSKKQIEIIFELAALYKKNASLNNSNNSEESKNFNNILKNKVLASCFFEPSTRTRLSFESAALHLNAKIIGFSSPNDTSIQKGESFKDTIKVISGYSDAIIIRHPYEGSAKLASKISNKPVINAGDGANQHPTQSLLDFFTIKEKFGCIDNLSIAIVGDLKYSRTVHSLIYLSAFYKVRLFFVSPKELSIPNNFCDFLKNVGIKFSMHEKLDDILDKIDVLYITRIQKERFDPSEYILIKKTYSLNNEKLSKARDHLAVMHPMPRLDEIPVEIDETQKALYFVQSDNGIYVRQAILALLISDLN